MGDPLFRRDGDAYIPTELTGSPWAADVLHGGPPAGLLTYGCERHVGDPEMQGVRLTFDLFRAIPRAPLHLEVETVRGGRRIHVVCASLRAEGVEVARANALFLRRSDAPAAAITHSKPVGPDGLSTDQGISHRDANGASLPPHPLSPRFPGFHTNIETRWAVGYGLEAPPAVWFRVPMPMIEGEPTTPLMRIGALSDFANALGNKSLDLSGTKLSYINTDISLSLHRNPEGEWLCLEAGYRAETAGVGIIDSAWYDARGRFATVIQSRLLNPR